MKEEGYNWKIAKERRDEERRQLAEKEDRLRRAETQRSKVLENVERGKKQQKITENLARLPENKKVLVEMELEKERRLILKEAREEVWKKWRQKKGRKSTNPHRNKDASSLDKKLERTEKEVEKYEADLKKQREQKLKRDT